MDPNSNQGLNTDNEYLKKLREMLAEREKATQGGHLPSYPLPRPCPDCGSCPTCGRRGRYTVTYGYLGYVYL